MLKTIKQEIKPIHEILKKIQNNAQMFGRMHKRTEGAMGGREDKREAEVPNLTR